MIQDKMITRTQLLTPVFISKLVLLAFPLGTLTEDVVFSVFCFLSISELATCAVVCKKFRPLVEDAITSIYHEIFGGSSDKVLRKTVLQMLGKAHERSVKHVGDLFLWSSAQGYIDYVSRAIDHGDLSEIKGGINMQDEHGFTPLHFAVEHGDMGLIKLLISSGSDPTRTTKMGTHVLHLAAKHGHKEILLHFLQVRGQEKKR